MYLCRIIPSLALLTAALVAGNEQASLGHIQRVFSDSLIKLQNEFHTSKSTGSLRSFSAISSTATSSVYSGFYAASFYLGSCATGSLVAIYYKDLSQCIYQPGGDDVILGYNLVGGVYFVAGKIFASKDGSCSGVFTEIVTTNTYSSTINSCRIDVVSMIDVFVPIITFPKPGYLATTFASPALCKSGKTSTGIKIYQPASTCFSGTKYGACQVGATTGSVIQKIYGYANSTCSGPALATGDKIFTACTAAGQNSTWACVTLSHTSAPTIISTYRPSKMPKKQPTLLPAKPSFKPTSAPTKKTSTKKTFSEA